MTMKTLFEIPTQGDYMTLPGGIALRARITARGPTPGIEYIVHNFNTDRETGTDRDYWQGSYCGGNLPLALDELTRRATSASRYETGGAIDYAKLIGFEAIPAGEVIASA